MSPSKRPSSSLDDTNLGRRRMLTAGAVAAGTAVLPWQLALASEMANAGTGKSMRRRPIPASGEPLPVMGMGSSGSFSTRSAAALADLRSVMQRFVALGGELLDTSPTYGNAEANIGRIAHATNLRDELFMATKVHEYGKQDGIEQMAASRKRLGEPIHLMQVHNLIDLETQWPTLQRMKADGEVRYIGITHYLTSAFNELERQMKRREMDFVQFNYSILTPDAERRLLPLAADRGIAVLINRVFNDGRFFGRIRGTSLPDYAREFDCTSWAQFALKYVLAHPAVTCAIPATGDPDHLRDNMQAGYGALPDKSQRKRMRATMEKI